MNRVGYFLTFVTVGLIVFTVLCFKSCSIAFQDFP